MLFAHSSSTTWSHSRAHTQWNVTVIEQPRTLCIQFWSKRKEGAAKKPAFKWKPLSSAQKSTVFSALFQSPLDQGLMWTPSGRHLIIAFFEAIKPCRMEDMTIERVIWISKVSKWLSSDDGTCTTTAIINWLPAISYFPSFRRQSTSNVLTTP